MRRTSLFLFLAAALAWSAAAQEKTLTVYTYESFTAEWGPGPKVKEAFEKTCSCVVDFVAVADGVALLSRLKLEDETTYADIALGLDTNLADAATDTGPLRGTGIVTSAVAVPWADGEGRSGGKVG